MKESCAKLISKITAMNILNHFLHRVNTNYIFYVLYLVLINGKKHPNTVDKLNFY